MSASAEEEERLAVAAFNAQRYDEAAARLQRALALAPSPRARYYLAGVYEAQGKMAEALKQYDVVLKADPRHPPTLVSRARLMLALDRPADALDNTDAALSVASEYGKAWQLRGEALARLGRAAEAQKSAERARLLAQPRLEQLRQTAPALAAAKRYEDALAACDETLALDPQDAQAHNHRGGVLFALGRDAEAEQAFLCALRIDPNVAAFWWNLGNVLTMSRRGDEAMAVFDQALRLKPDFPRALESRGNWRADVGEYAAAADSFEALRRLEPDHPFASGRLLSARRALGDWRDHDALLAEQKAQVASGKRRMWPLEALNVLDDPALQRAVTEYFARDMPREAPLPGAARGSSGGKIRLGYVSADFHLHAVAHLIVGAYEAHDRTRFELVGFAVGENHNDAMRARTRTAFDDFNVVPLTTSHRDVAALMREKEIDVAIDLTGFTLNGRTPAFYYRPAPVQVNYLGYPGTLGVDFMDYIIADSTLIAPEDERFYSEKVVRLPFSYQPNTPHSAGPAPTRASLGLPENGVVFCCFNSAMKITPETFAIWMRILTAVERSVLWLFAKPEAAVNLKRTAQAAGVAPERLVFADFVNHEGHLARLGAADLVLDTWPYGAHTTASDALWMGVPVITWAGGAFASRVATSLVRAAGLAELSVASAAEYEARAIALARDPTRLAALKAKVAAARGAPLFDVTATTRALEYAYERMVARARAGLAPEGFDVPGGR